MKKLLKICVFLGVSIGLITFGISKYGTNRIIKKKNFYITNVRNMIIGGMSSDKDKIESFKKDLEKDDDFNKYWDNLHIATRYEKNKNYNQAIIYYKKALELAKTKGDVFQVIWGLARLYEKNGQYDRAIEELEKVKTVNDREDVLEEVEEIKERLIRLKSESK